MDAKITKSNVSAFSYQPHSCLHGGTITEKGIKMKLFALNANCRPSDIDDTEQMKILTVRIAVISIALLGCVSDTPRNREDFTLASSMRRC